MQLVLLLILPAAFALSEMYGYVNHLGDVQRTQAQKATSILNTNRRLQGRRVGHGKRKENKSRAHTRMPRMHFTDLDDDVFYGSLQYPVLPEISRCKSNSSNLKSQFPEEKCHGHASSATSGAAPAWGLSNSTTCPESSFLIDELPALHKQWKAAGKVLLACVDGPLGNYLSGITQGFLASLLLKRAFVIHCDHKYAVDGKHPTSALMRHYFRSPHIDWNDNFGMDPHINISHWFLPEEAIVPENVTTAAVHVRTNVHTELRKSNFDRISTILGETLAGHHNLRGCLLRYLLMPSTEIEDVIRTLPNTPPVQSDGLLAAITLHVRVGDSVFTSDQHASYWPWANLTYAPPIINQPLETLHCLAIQSNAGTRCLQTIVVADSQDVLDCAEAVLERPVITPGVPVHLQASNSTELSVKSNVRKVFLDWWLAARSYAIASQGAYRSSFLETARQFRDTISDRPRLLPC